MLLLFERLISIFKRYGVRIVESSSDEDRLSIVTSYVGIDSIEHRFRFNFEIEQRRILQMHEDGTFEYIGFFYPNVQAIPEAIERKLVCCACGRSDI